MISFAFSALLLLFCAVAFVGIRQLRYAEFDIAGP